MVLGVILESVGGLGDTFSDFRGSWNQVGIFMHFGIPPGSPKTEATQKVDAKKVILGHRRQTKSRLPIPLSLILRLH